jgi:1,4-dihydroxy-2-naphthoate octaprenyltransferase
VSPYYAYHATVVAVLLGWAASYAETLQTLWPELGLTLVGALVIHTSAAFFNEYYDFVQRADAYVEHDNPYAGGSRVVYLESGVKPRHLLAASFAFASLGTVIGLALVAWKGVPVLLLGLLGYAVFYSYTGPPMKFAYRGLGELSVGLSFGPLLVMGSYYVQTQRFDGVPLAASTILGLFIVLVLLFNEFPDYAGDLRSGKRNLVVRLTRRRAMGLCGILLTSSYGLLLVFVLSGVLPLLSLLALVTLPLSAYAFRTLRDRYDDPDGMRPANAAMLVNHFVLGTSLVVGFLL